MYKTSEELLTYAKMIEGFSLNEKCDVQIDRRGKGKLGQLVETSYFGYANNSKKDADFEELGIELKVVPLKKIKSSPSNDLYRVRMGLAAKERISITMINYNELVNETWENATLRKKIKMLLMFYIHINQIDVKDLVFELIDLWEPSHQDIVVIEQDWNYIRDKVTKGKAHLLSEGDTLLLGAATKGATSLSVTTQPNSTELAKTRAFSLKPSYVNSIFEELIKQRSLKKIEESLCEFSDGIYAYILDVLKSNIGSSLSEMKIKYKLSRLRTAKQYIYLVITDLLDSIVGSRDSRIAELDKANIEIKTIILKPNRIPKESMSFEQINYEEMMESSWEDSIIHSKFEEIKQLWVVFEATKNYSKQKNLSDTELILTDVFYWNMPFEDLESDYKQLWNDTAKKVKCDDFNNFLKSSENRIGHIRPKATNKLDMQETRFGPREKKCFWLNSNYISDQIKKKRNE